MKNLLMLLCCAAFLSCSTSKILDGGRASLSQKIETLNFNYVYGIPLVEVEIGEKKYNFLIDTGAPTVISTEIYEDLQLQALIKQKVKDSQNNSQKQVFTTIPMMKVQDIVYQNVGAVVMDFGADEFKCFKLDGILGANQMALNKWKFNLSDKKVEITNELQNWDLSEFVHKVKFKTKDQKTPLIKSEVFGQSVEFTFDTGFNGALSIDHIPQAIINDSINRIETVGAGSIGITGKTEESKQFIFRMNELKIDDLVIDRPVLDTSKSALIGNELLENFEFIVDWDQQLIYFKPLQKPNFSYDAMGYGFRFIDGKAIVTHVYKHPKIKLNLGDQILSINNVSYENLTPEQQCKINENRRVRQKATHQMKIKRGEEILDIEVNSMVFFADEPLK